MQNYILPNAAFVARSRAEISLKLAESLHHIIFDVLGPNFGAPISEQKLHRLMSGELGFPNAATFALHGALLHAVLHDDVSEIPEFFRILKDDSFWNNSKTDGLSIWSLSEETMNSDKVFLLKRAFADDVGLTTTLVAPTQLEVDQGTLLVNEAFRVLEQTAPDWSEELLLLANQVYFATSDSQTGRHFQGGAVFDAFGAILMNPRALGSASTVLMTLVHESSHQQMFLYHLNDPILRNDAGAVYTSPLRNQPRPMEGIFHALWVSARMVAAVERVLNSPNRPVWAGELKEHQTRAYEAFRDCELTVAEHAELTELGSRLFESARETIDAI